METKIEKKQIVLIAIAVVVVAGYAFYEFFIYDDGFSNPAPASTNQKEEFIPAPKEASLNEYREATEDPELIDPGARSQLEDLYHQRLVAQIQADIATFKKTQEQAKIETAKGKAEIEEMKARTERERKMADIEARQAQYREERQQPAPSIEVPSRTESPERPVSRPITGLDEMIERKLEQAIPKPEQNASVHQVTGSGTLLTVDGAMRRLALGQSAGGVRLVSADPAGGSVVVQGVASGERATLLLNDNTSRTFGRPRPLNEQARDGGTEVMMEEPTPP